MARKKIPSEIRARVIDLANLGFPAIRIVAMINEEAGRRVIGKSTVCVVMQEGGVSRAQRKIARDKVGQGNINLVGASVAREGDVLSEGVFVGRRGVDLDFVKSNKFNLDNVSYSDEDVRSLVAQNALVISALIQRGGVVAAKIAEDESVPSDKRLEAVRVLSELGRVSGGSS